MSKIGYARILEGYKPFKDPAEENVNTTFRGQIETDNEEVRFAIIKALHGKELANEIVATIIGAKLGLKVPECYLALAPDNSANFENAVSLDGERLLFCSCDVGAPSVAAVFSNGNTNVSSDGMRRIVDRLVNQDIASLYEFDEWMANVDRHHGNLLLAGSGDMWLIDHGNCITGHMWSREKLDSTVRYRNKLQKWVTPYLLPSEIDNAVRNLGRVQTLALAMNVRDTVGENIVEGLLDDADVEGLIVFLEERIPRMRDFATEAFGKLA
ncbi:hypothetical protein FY137_09665 [Agrobacterium tumefaciens]|nr:hypothetical protein FY137_09665 [Agrobacterium tumefaciens]